MNNIVERLREYQESWADSIKRMDCGELGDNGIMSQIRAEQHETWKDAADLIEAQEQRIKELEAYTKSLETSRGELVETQAEKITEQRKRIKELEAALCEEVEARSKWYCEADRLKEELAAALRAAIESAQKVEPVSDDRLLLQQVFSICEASEDECHGSDNPFNRGRAFEAKRIRNGIGNWYQDTFCGKSFMGEPVTAFAYAEYIESPDGVPDEERK